MSTGIYRAPPPINEPVRAYAPGSPERARVEAELARQAGSEVEIPCVIGGRRVFTGNTVDVFMPSDRGHRLARVHIAGDGDVRAAIDAAMEARESWAKLPLEQRTSIMLRAAELLAGPWRDRVNAATMLGQAKTVHQAEIDAVCELVDFLRFNALYAEQIAADQPPVSPTGMWNRLDHRPLDGFVFAIAPFNFSSIAVNLCTAPAIMGNTVVWKPTIQSLPSCWQMLQMLEEAGLPPGVINLVNGHGADVGDIVLADPRLGGVHFTGSTPVFQGIWKTIGNNIANYRQYPRLVGETGGKDFILAHPSADPTAVAVGMLRGAFEYQGQKCSAASRMYLPASLWPTIREQLVAGAAEMKQGDVRDFSNFVSAVFDERAYDRHAKYQAYGNANAETVLGGTNDRSKGWFIHPTVYRVDDPQDRLMKEEIFGPIATVFVYEDAAWEDAIRLVDTTSPYALTGAVFSRDRYAIDQATEGLRFAAGNFYVNDKPTGAVVGQQPFGGSRASGTNDKAGSALNLLRWTSPRTIKETFVSATDWRYPFLG